MKTNLKIIFAALLFTCFSTNTYAADAYGPMGKRFGLGVVLGEPTGLTAKGYLSPKMAVSGAASWSFLDESLVFTLDGTYEVLSLHVDSNVNRTVDLPVYVGIGGLIGFNDNNGAGNDDTRFVLRVPVGLAAQWRNYPFEVFAELVPGMALAPATDFDFMAGLGARFYF